MTSVPMVLCEAESDFLTERALQFVGGLPAELKLYNLYTAFALKTATDSEAAKALVAFLTTPAAAQVFRGEGYEPRF